jgi:hypothetical protein
LVVGSGWLVGVLNVESATADQCSMFNERRKMRNERRQKRKE